ncbi:hypothetical protein BDA96_01G317200 [Sorghum bicolor]|uniref:Uncharacterized protein n=1 Tax=Sorghum bicolor TaxID=4558 RepID=A0A921V202_SORBI|nr:hypothetical protein BDA96_01G317200 [Sorghum bicolor]
MALSSHAPTPPSSPKLSIPIINIEMLRLPRQVIDPEVLRLPNQELPGLVPSIMLPMHPPKHPWLPSHHQLQHCCRCPGRESRRRMWRIRRHLPSLPLTLPLPHRGR